MSALHMRHYAPVKSVLAGSAEAREEVIDGDADSLNNPPHYQLRNGVQSMDLIESTMTSEQFEGFLRGNALKYLIRYNRKGTPKADLRKALDYVTRLKKVVDA